MGKQNWRKKKGTAKRTSNIEFIKDNCFQVKNQKTLHIPLKNNLKEVDVGITEYLNDNPGFHGVIKSRFSDFHVNEIDLEGCEIKLTDQSVPQPIKTETDLKFINDSLNTVLTETIWNSLNEMIKNKNDENIQVDIDVTSLDKEKRTDIHKTLKAQYGKNIVSTTVSEEEKKLIRCTNPKMKGGVERTNWQWPGDYVHFVLYKENYDTVQAASDLAKQLRMQPSNVNYAGTKDKRAKTSQMFCIKKWEPSRILKAANRYSQIKVGNFQFKNKVLKLGDLSGNRFRIVLRDITEDEKLIEQSIRSLKENGFINYYGLQRFGNNANVSTYEIGLALLKGNYKEACELILKPRENETGIIKEVRDLWWKTRDSKKAASILQNCRFLEKRLLDGLSVCGENDYVTALRKIPRNMLLLYTHAYQSLVFNKIASLRIKEFGLKLIPGDLVYRDNSTTEVPIEDLSTDYESEIMATDPESSFENKELANQSTEKLEKQSIFKNKVKSLTENDINSGKYSIFDVVLALPGHDISYPTNKINDWYVEILQKDNLSSDKLKSNIKTFSLAGAYRKLLVRPSNLKWEFKQYSSPTTSLIDSDYDILKGIDTKKDNENGNLKALLLDFILPPAAYATMALREILKEDTSSAHQTEITKKTNNQIDKKENEIECEKRNAEENLNENVKKIKTEQ